MTAAEHISPKETGAPQKEWSNWHAQDVAWKLSRSIADHTARHVLLAVARRVDMNGRTFVGEQAIADDVGVSRQTVSEKLKYLDEKVDRFRIEKGTFYRGRRRRRLYYFEFRSAEVITLPAGSNVGKTDIANQTNVKSANTPEQTNVKYADSMKRVGSQNQDSLSGNSSTFQALWAGFERAYPFRDSENRKCAKRVFWSLSVDECKAAIDGISEYMAALKRDGLDNPVFAKTYLEDRVFEQFPARQSLGSTGAGAGKADQPGGSGEALPKAFVARRSPLWPALAERHCEHHQSLKVPLRWENAEPGWYFPCEWIDQARSALPGAAEALA